VRISSVTAHAFGPFRGETLEFADGMTVIVGDNESGKSSWHAAIFAALCGMRRRRGSSRAEQEFARRHRPWGDDRWLVSATLRLDDDRVIEMRQDLANRVDCHAFDITLGRDVSAEVMNDGTPDASKWLGLDRSSFLATACIKQGQILQVTEDADALQDHLQRAAATAGGAGTAAKAIARLNNFARERIGADRTNSTKPLRQAWISVETAQNALEKAKSVHDEYTNRLAQISELRQRLAEAKQAVRLHEAASARDEALELSRATSRAKEIHERLGGVEPPSALEDDDLASQVTGALATWRSCPPVSPPPQRTSEQILNEIRALPDHPEGDTEPHNRVIQAEKAAREAQIQLESHSRSAPRTEFSAPDVPATDQELFDLIQAIQLGVPDIPAGLSERVRAAEGAVTRAQQRERTSIIFIAIGATLAAIGLLLLVTVGILAGIGAVAAGTAVGVYGVLQRSGVSSTEANREFAEARAALQAAQHRAQEAHALRQHAAARCTALGVSATPEALRAVLDARTTEREYQRQRANWEKLHQELVEANTRAASMLAAALNERGHYVNASDSESLFAAVDEYRRTCRERAELAARASRKADLERELQVVLQAERKILEDQRSRDQAAEQLIVAARECGTETHDPVEAAEALQRWLDHRSERLAELDSKRDEWTELQRLLDGQSLEELEASAGRAALRAKQLAQDLDENALASIPELVADERLPELRRAAADTERRLLTQEGELQQFERHFESVSEAEEALARAQAKLDQVRELKETVELTRGFLERAQEQIHRDITPILVATLRKWLPKITHGRYSDATIDPATLQVKVRNESGQLREAHLLSHGTAEQTYLLLRIALADHVTRGHDTCPLVLDDITVHTDSKRTRALLDLLLEIASERQVILFTQEQEVAEWAHSALRAPGHAVRELRQLAAA